MTQPSQAPGWYPDPSNPSRQIYWDGRSWSLPSSDTSGTSGKNVAIAISVCVLAGIGLMMSMQSISLMTGTGPIWTGVALVGAGVAVAFLMRGATWVKAVACLVLAFALLNAFYMESQLNEKREEISEIFGG